MRARDHFFALKEKSPLRAMLDLVGVVGEREAGSGRLMQLRADARQIPLRDGCVQCVVTSPPYFGLRDYGNPQQLGIEATPDAYVAALVAVFAEVRRVLKDDGTVWLNLGDSYNSSSQHNHGKGGDMAHRHLAPIDGWAGHRPNV